MATATYTELKRQNEQAASIINDAWGERVAWVEDRPFLTPHGSPFTLPVVVSRLVCGMLPGRHDVPPFFDGAALGRIK